MATKDKRCQRPECEYHQWSKGLCRKHYGQEWSVNYYAKHSEEIRARSLAWRRDHPEEAATKSKKWKQKNSEKVKAREAKRRSENREKIRAQHAAYCAANAEKMRKYYADYRIKNMLKIKAYSSVYSKQHAEKARKRAATWQRSNPERASANYAARRARERGAMGRHTGGEIKALYKKQRGCCAVCCTRLSKYHKDHIISLAGGGADDIGNIQLLCPLCNLSKSTKHPVDFMRERGFLL